MGRIELPADSDYRHFKVLKFLYEQRMNKPSIPNDLLSAEDLANWEFAFRWNQYWYHITDQGFRLYNQIQEDDIRWIHLKP